MTAAVGRSSRRLVALAAVAVVSLVIAAACQPPPTPGGIGGSKPNILFVLADDLDPAELAFMPKLEARLVTKGTSFSNYGVSVSLCCPSRSTTLRGQYSHNTGIETNSGTNGGFATAYANGLEASTVATWLHGSGYYTGLVGKYLNGYPNTAAQTYVPPGWDEWYSAVGGGPAGGYDYTLNENGTLVTYGSTPADFATDVYSRKTQELVTRAAQAGKPFFAYLAVHAPHKPATPAPRDVGTFVGAQAPRTPNYNEADVSDKPAWVQARPLMTPQVQADTDALYQLRLESLQAVDDAVADLVNTLRANGQLDNTFIVFTSDNGFHLGNHRLPSGKQTAYEEDIRVPFVVRGPGVPKGATLANLIGNVDLAPTFAALGGLNAPSFVDGRSFTALLRANPPSASTGRQSFLVEHWRQAGTAAAGTAPTDAPDADEAPTGPKAIPEFHGVRTERYTYVEYVTGERELYDRSVDPFELVNVVTTADPALVTRLHDRVVALQGCAGASCRSIEAAPI